MDSVDREPPAADVGGRAPAGPTRTRSEEWARGWRPALGIAVGYAAGGQLIIQTASVFIRPITEATGWSTTQALLAPLISLIYAFMGPLSGRAVDRWGPRRVALFGLLGLALTYAGFTLAPLSHVTYYTFAALLGIFGGLAFLVPFNRAISSWFDKTLGRALAFMGFVGVTISAVMIPVTSAVVYAYGFRAGYLTLAAAIAFIAIPAIIWGTSKRHGSTLEESSIAPTAGRRTANEERPRTGITIIQGVRNPLMWAIGIALATAGAALTGIFQNLQPLLIDNGIAPIVAASVGSLFLVGALLGRTVAGFLLDVAWRYHVAMMMFAVVTVGILLLSFSASLSFLLIVVAVILIGVGYGSEADFVAYFTLREFGRENFAVMFGLLLLSMNLGSFVGPYFFAAVKDATQSYSWAIYAGAGLLVLSIVFLGIIGRVRHKAEAKLGRDPIVDLAPS